MKSVAAFVLFALVGLSPAVAADWPTQPIHIISPYPPSGSTDRVARVFADFLSQRLNTPVIVDNRVGGGSAVGAMQAARAAPDGYTLLLSGIATYVIAPTMNAGTLPDPLTLFTDIAYLGGAPTCMVVSGKSPIKSLADIKTRVQAGETFLYSTVGVGSLGNMVGEEANHDADLRMTHVPYNTLNLADVIEGRVQFGLFAWTSVQGLVESGDLRLIAVSSHDRLPSQPNVMTFEEQGVHAVVDAWLSLSGPKSMPQPVVERLNASVTDFLSTPSVREKLAADIFEWKTMSPTQFSAFVKDQIATWAPRIRAAMASGQK